MSILALKEFATESEDKNANRQLKYVLRKYNTDLMKMKHCPKDVREGSSNKQWRRSGAKAGKGQQEQGWTGII